MLCDRCKKREATRHESVRIDDGTWSEVHLCDQCSEKSEVTLLTPAGLVQALIEGAATLAEGRAPGGVRACPKCGITYAEFRAKGRLGCAHDYEVFQPEMLPLLERIHHGGLQHVGKSPASTEGRSDSQRELIELRRSLTESIQRERYEEAARIRDRIRALEEGREPPPLPGPESPLPPPPPPPKPPPPKPPGERKGRKK